MRLLSRLCCSIVSKLIMYRLMEVSAPFGFHDPGRLSFQSQLNTTSCAPWAHCSKIGSESSCGIAHHMPLGKLTRISLAKQYLGKLPHAGHGPVETVGPAGTGLGCSVADPVVPGGPAGRARLVSISMSGCSVADLVTYAPAMVLRRELGKRLFVRQVRLSNLSRKL